MGDGAVMCPGCAACKCGRIVHDRAEIDALRHALDEARASLARVQEENAKLWGWYTTSEQSRAGDVRLATAPLRDEVARLRSRAVEIIVRTHRRLWTANRRAEAAESEVARLREALLTVSEWGCMCPPGKAECPACVAERALRPSPAPILRATCNVCGLTVRLADDGTIPSHPGLGDGPCSGPAPSPAPAPAPIPKEEAPPGVAEIAEVYRVPMFPQSDAATGGKCGAPLPPVGGWRCDRCGTVLIRESSVANGRCTDCLITFGTGRSPSTGGDK